MQRGETMDGPEAGSKGKGTATLKGGAPNNTNVIFADLLGFSKMVLVRNHNNFKIISGPSPCLYPYLFLELFSQLFQQSEALPAMVRHLTMLWQQHEGSSGMTPSWYISQVSCGTLSAAEA